MLGNDGQGPYAIAWLGIKVWGIVFILLMFYGALCLKFYADCYVNARAQRRLEEIAAAGGSLSTTATSSQVGDDSSRRAAPAGGKAGGLPAEFSPTTSTPVRLGEGGTHKSSGSVGDRDSASAGDPENPSPRMADAHVRLSSNERHHVSTSL